MYIHKLEYVDLNTALVDLEAKSVLVRNEENELVYKYPTEDNPSKTHAVVHLGNIQISVDGDGNSTFSDKHHVDIMIDWEIDFGNAEAVIAEGDPVAHKFA